MIALKRQVDIRIKQSFYAKLQGLMEAPCMERAPSINHFNRALVVLPATSVTNFLGVVTVMDV
jgi:hypothetical protein